MPLRRVEPLSAKGAGIVIGIKCSDALQQIEYTNVRIVQKRGVPSSRR